MLAVLMEDTRYFRIGDKQCEFKDKDEIFAISGPTPKKESLLAESAQCTICFSNFKSVKSVAYWYAIIYFFVFQIYDIFSSDFCGSPVCKTCLIKHRPFPSASRSLSSDSSDVLKGHSCKVCDRKFYIKEIFKSSRLVIEEQAEEILNLRRQLEQQDQQCKALENDFKRYQGNINGEKEKNSVIKKKNKKVKKTLEHEVSAMNEECDSQTRHKEKVVQEISELKETIEQLMENIDELNEQLFRVDLKSN
jgi:hypothetical protein